MAPDRQPRAVDKLGDASADPLTVVPRGGVPAHGARCGLPFKSRSHWRGLGAIAATSERVIDVRTAKRQVAAASAVFFILVVPALASGGQNPNLENNVGADVVLLAPVGGRNLRLTSAPDGPVQLTWDPGIYQAGYYIWRYNPVRGVTLLPGDGMPLAGDATSFEDAAPARHESHCYVVIAVDASGSALGRSDMLCIKSMASAPAPTDFSIELRQTSIARLRWSGPGGQTNYLLLGIPQDGGEHWEIPLSGASTQFYHFTNGRTFCYTLMPRDGTTPLGYSDTICAVPGFSDLNPWQ
jgi:hypothetical protein